MIPFKDISYAQGQYNMDADPDPAVAMKASGFYTGSKLPYLDDQLVRNYADAIRLGKVPIMYHFAGGSDPATEAAYFIAAIHPLVDGDCYALDWEIEVADPVSWCLTFLTKVHDATGVWPWIYMDRDRRGRFNWDPILAHSGLWIAAPDVPFDSDIPNIGIYIAQQGPIVNGVDSDMFFGDIDQLKAYSYHAAVPTPTPPVEPVPDPATTSTTTTLPPATTSTTSSTTTTTQSTTTTLPPIVPPKQSFWQWLFSIIKAIFTKENL